MAAALGVSADKLRPALRECGLPLAPLVEGVRQANLPELDRTLSQLAAEYQRGEPARRRLVRQTVITARQHAEWALRRLKSADGKRPEKEEMLLWIRTWLENPPLFPAWAKLRARRMKPREESHE